MSSFLGIDSDVWVIILTIIIVIQGFAYLLRRRSSGIEPTTADLIKEILKKIPAPKTTEEDFSRLAEQWADERIEKIKKEMSEEMEIKISEISRKSEKTDAQIAEIKISMKELLGKAIIESRHVEKDAELETLKNRILVELLDLMRRGSEVVNRDELRYVLELTSLMDIGKALDELQEELLVQIVEEELLLLTRRGCKKAEEISSFMI